MIRAYGECYLDLAQQNLASMLDHAVNDLQFDIDEFFSLFTASGIAKQFGSGDYRYISGMSGIELAYAVLEKVGLEERIKDPHVRFDRSMEFWTGWVMAFYQWWSALTFDEIFMLFPPSRIRLLYHPYHEMDIMHVCEKIDRICRKETRLKNMRVRAGISQAQLAKLSGVSLRCIQQYEQRERNINKAHADTVASLAAALFTQSSRLLENI